ncbi:hypothetical protein M0804_004932 [Polistes exclamans]|nr:hypothetical protein M0804_004932 [Polistes exclamans]
MVVGFVVMLELVVSAVSVSMVLVVLSVVLSVVVVDEIRSRRNDVGEGLLEEKEEEGERGGRTIERTMGTYSGVKRTGQTFNQSSGIAVVTGLVWADRAPGVRYNGHTVLVDLFGRTGNTGALPHDENRWMGWRWGEVDGIGESQEGEVGADFMPASI